jgi:hypothetical protein
MKRTLPLAVTFLTGMLMVIAFLIPHPPLGGLQDRFLNWYLIVVGFTMLLGVHSLVRMHLRKLSKKQSGWGYSLVLLLTLVLTVAVGVWSWIGWRSIIHPVAPFMYIYTHLIIPLQATMFALLAFFIASAAYRAFRARTVDATLLLIAAGIVMLGRVPVGTYLTRAFPHFLQLPVVADWIMDIPQLAAKRGILIGAYLGAVAMSLRIILGIERTYLA